VLFFVLSMPSDSGGPRRGQSRASQVLENQELPYFEAISPASLCLSLIWTYSLASRAPINSAVAAQRSAPPYSQTVASSDDFPSVTINTIERA
jgi:hypothetical protein